LIPATSDPAHGSVIARHILFSPLKTGPTILCYNYFEPYFMMGGSPVIIY